MGSNLKKILYVDDEEINLELFRITFRNSFDVITVKTPQEGLQILEEQEIPMVVSDYRMPRMNGIEFFEEVKRTSPQTVCILITGFFEIITEDKEHLVFNTIQKPWKKEEVLQIFSSGIEQYQLNLAN